MSAPRRRRQRADNGDSSADSIAMEQEHRASDETLASLVDAHRLIVCVGPGGVGKTTLAAALALDAAQRGRRVAVLTIDPAHRLADALGLDGLDDALRPVAIDGPGSLDAAMLDTKRAYDALIGRIAKDDEARQQILANRVYQSFSRTLARSHAYVAMERLYDVLDAGGHDLVVLDTPPTRSALDILDAPGRLARFLDERVLGAFLGEPAGVGGWVRAKGAAIALRLFGALVGDALVQELASFFAVLFHLRHGFAARASAVHQALQGPDTAFLLVTAPEPTHLADAAYLRDGLGARGAPLAAILFNRAFYADARGRPIGAAAPYPDDDGWPDAPARACAVLEAARAVREALARENRARDLATRAFVTESGGALRRWAFPIEDDEPTTLPALRALLARGA